MAVWVPILVAILTGLVTVITVFITGRANRDLEREKFKSREKPEHQKFESSLILHAIATGRRETALKNLQFLVRAGFLNDPEGRIKELSERTKETVRFARLGWQTVSWRCSSARCGSWHSSVGLSKG